jgi:sulfite reductase alpha subunit-like flavoprotein
VRSNSANAAASHDDDHDDHQLNFVPSVMADEETRSLLILYATETGNALDAADFIARQCRRIAFHCRVADIETFSLVS